MPTIPSNRLRHGLASRAFVEARGVQAVMLARALISNLPASDEVFDAARALAEVTLQLQAVQEAKRAFLSNGSGNKKAGHKFGKVQPLRNDPSEPALPWTEEDIGVAGAVEAIRLNAKIYRRLEEYERKSASRRKRLLIRFDYVALEARRRHAGIQETGPRTRPR